MLSTTKRLLAVGTAVAISLIGFMPAVPAQASPATAARAATTQAANWLASHPATTDEGYGYQLYNATGLALTATSATADELRTRVAALRAGAATAVAGKPGTAASLTILAKALHLNPKSFGGTNLVSALTSGISADGQVGSYGSAYGQATAIIALKRAGAHVPTAVVTTLLTYRDATTGAFGYEYNGFNADPDSTALAIQALNLLGGHRDIVAKAVAWAQSTQTTAGYWESWSPVDSTALMASSFKTSNKATFKTLASSYAKAYQWLRTQQLKDGGFPASLNGTSSDQMATYDATYLLTGKTLATFTYSLRHFTKTPRPVITGTAKPGKTLTAKAGSWKPAGAVAFQWLRSGKAVAGATTATYSVTKADVGKKLRVRVTVSGIGLKTVVRVSAAKVAHR
jgi:hypothetical protein